MLKKIHNKSGRLLLLSMVLLMLLGTPIVAPVYADCSTSTNSCTSSG